MQKQHSWPGALQLVFGLSKKTCLLLWFLVAAVAHAAPPQTQSLTKPLSDPNNPRACAACHQQVYAAWQGSHHAQAMAHATPATVLGDFSAPAFQKGFASKQTAVDGKRVAALTVKFGKQNNQYQMTLTEDGETNSHKIDYVFGVSPLQQYLTQVEKGRWQVLPVAWDARPADQGGQAWIYLYEDHIAPNDRLHWLQPLQNWNGMCADCHSDGLKRGYQAAENQFDSTWSHISVGCRSCHDNIDATHLKLGQAIDKENGLSGSSGNNIHKQNAQGVWHPSTDNSPPVWQGEKRHNQFMETCFACHALRTPLTDGFQSTDKFLDAFTPTFLPPNLYHADGQIDEEVYVYGSFLQSKMYQAGVNCLDCHDPHSYELKLKGNAVCTQCHTATQYDVTAHTRHPKNSAGGACVACHMPATTYMKVDDRRDHSFSIPRPKLTQQYGVPNACQNCHQDKTPQWMIKAINQWQPKQLLRDAEQAYINFMAGAPLTVPALIQLAGRPDLSVIKRASLIERLPELTDMLRGPQLQDFLSHQDPLLRLAAVRVANLIVAPEKESHIAPLLKDEYRAIRVKAYEQLIGGPLDEMKSAVNKKHLQKVAEEFHQAIKQTLWRGEGRINQALSLMRAQNQDGAEYAYRKSIDIDPYFEPAYINLADIYRAQNKSEQALNILLQGVAALPKSAHMHYSLGLYYVRADNAEKTLDHLAQAVRFDPGNERFAYTYILALQKFRSDQKALCRLRASLADHPEFTSLQALAQQWRLRSSQQIDCGGA